MNQNTVVMVSLLALCWLHCSQADLGLVRNFIQFNIAGLPVIHKTESWPFDPEVAVKRRPQYYEQHGYRGEKAIERVGLGIDGKAEERLKQQRIRDEGHLQGLNYLTP